MTDEKFIAEADISVERLDALCTGASYSTFIKSIENQPLLFVEKDGKLVSIAVSNEEKWLVFGQGDDFEDDVENSLKFDYANYLNVSGKIATFSVSRPDGNSITATYFLPFAGGVTAAQIISALELFANDQSLMRSKDSFNVLKKN